MTGHLTGQPATPSLTGGGSLNLTGTRKSGTFQPHNDPRVNSAATEQMNVKKLDLRLLVIMNSEMDGSSSNNVFRTS